MLTTRFDWLRKTNSQQPLRLHDNISNDSACNSADTHASSLTINFDENLSDFFEINSRALLDTARSTNATKIILNIDSKKLSEFLSDLRDFGEITHLVIKSENFTPSHGNCLKEIIRIKKKLEYVWIDCDLIYSPGTLVEQFYFYSSLETLIILAKNYQESYSKAKEMNLTVKRAIDEQCSAIINLNKQTREFLSEELPVLNERMKEWGVELSNKAVSELTPQQTEFLISLGKQFDFFSKLEGFHSGLRLESPVFKLIYDLASQWDIKNIVSHDDEVQKFNIIRTSSVKLDFNQLFNETLFPTRLIDLAVCRNAVAIVESLISLKVDVTRMTHDAENLPIPTLNPTGWYTFPFGKALRSNNKPLKAIFFNNENALYDGLAWLICEGKRDDFDEITNEVNIDINKTIPAGEFADFTLLQVMIYSRQTDLSLEYIKRFSKQLTTSVNQLYPNKLFFPSLSPSPSSFPFSGWSLLAVILYQGQYEELTLLSSEITFEAIQLNSLAALLLQGASEVRASKNLPLEKIDKDLEKYQRCFDLLMKIEHISQSIGSVKLKKCEETGNYSELPILHFTIYNKIFLVIKNHLAKFQGSLQESVNVSEIGQVTPLELAVRLCREENVIKSLFELYKSILAMINDPLPSLSGVNIFQYSILSENFPVFKECIALEECNINAPFPLAHPNYPEWLPLHVVILQAFFTKHAFLDLFLTRQDSDIKVPFKEEGKPHYLANYYPLSAIFFSSTPLKDNALTAFNLSNKLEAFLLLANKLSKNVKRNILNQALYLAVVHHNKKTQHDYSEAITTLVKVGANPCQSYGAEGNLIIDLAKEKGILHLFPGYLEEQIKSLSLQSFLLSGNTCVSALQQFSDRSLDVNEDYYSVVSLLRNEKSTNSEHVFIVIEQIINGRYVMHFADFVKDLDNPGKGKVRYKKLQGKMGDPTLLFKCDLSMMQIKKIEDLRCLPPWQITNRACEKLLTAINSDKDKEINYALAGDKSVFTRSSSKKGHNCYTWARETILKSEDRCAGKDLKATWGEWLGSLPSLKATSKNKH